MRLTPQIKDLRDEGGYNEPSVFLVFIKNLLSHLHTNSASWLANKSFGTGSLGDKMQRLLAHSLKFLNAHCVLASVLSGITPLLAFSLSGDDIGFENRCCGLTPLGSSDASAKESSFEDFPTGPELVTSFILLRDFLSDKESFPHSCLLLFGSGVVGCSSVVSYGDMKTVCRC